MGNSVMLNGIEYAGEQIAGRRKKAISNLFLEGQP